MGELRAFILSFDIKSLFGAALAIIAASFFA